MSHLVVFRTMNCGWFGIYHHFNILSESLIRLREQIRWRNRWPLNHIYIYKYSNLVRVIRTHTL